MHELQLSFWRLDGFAAICHQLWLPRWTFVRHVGAGPPWMPTGHSWMLWLQCMQSWHESWDHTLLERMMQSSNQLHATCGMHTAHHICGVQVRICILPTDMYSLLTIKQLYAIVLWECFPSPGWSGNGIYAFWYLPWKLLLWSPCWS